MRSIMRYEMAMTAAELMAIMKAICMSVDCCVS